MDLWQEIKGDLEKSGRKVKFFDGNAERGASELEKFGIPASSTIGMVIINTNGFSVDNWIFVLGQSSDERAGFVDFNERIGRDFGDFMVIATDAVGGVFALHGVTVWYFAPDALRWEDLGIKYAQFITWLAQGDLAMFYETARWSGWEKDVAELDGFQQGFSIYPFLWTKECDIETASKKIVPLAELIGSEFETAEQLA